MQSWVNFWNLIFWLSIIGFLINLENFFKILLYSGIVWVILYAYTVSLGSISNDINIIGMSFYILALAGLEFSIGILLLIIFKNNNKSLSLDNNSTKNKLTSNKNIKNINKMYWNIKQ